MSVILPYLDREDFLPRTLQSLLCISLRPLQIILVDNGSGDSSRHICLDFEQKHNSPHLQIVNISEPHSGVCCARNAGLKAATAPYVFFFDSDDVISPDFLSNALSCVNKHCPEADIISAPTTIVFPDGKQQVRFTCSTPSLTDQILTGMLSTQSMVFRKDFLMHIGGWNEQLRKWNDWELGLRAIASGAHIHWIDKPYHLLYQHLRTITWNASIETFSAMHKALQSAIPLIDGDISARQALSVRAMLLSADMRKHGLYSEAESLEQEFPMTGIRCRLIRIYSHIYNKGVWRIARAIL